MVKFNGTVTSNIVPPIVRSNWNDPLDGTGASGLVWDWDLTVIFDIEYVWGGTSVNFYAYVNGQKILFHTVAWAGSSSDVGSAITLNPSLATFTRLEVLLDSDSMVYIGSSLYNLGDSNTSSITFAENSMEITIPPVSGYYVVLAVRKKQFSLHCLLKEVSAMSTSADNYCLCVVKNPVLSAGVLTFTDPTGGLGSESGLEFAVGDGSQMVSSYDYQISSHYSNKEVAIFERVEGNIGMSVLGESDVFAVLVMPINLAGPTKISASMSVSII
jgi:hypothetical protein